jgi:hemin uptake protein HemP
MTDHPPSTTRLVQVSKDRLQSPGKTTTDLLLGPDKELIIEHAGRDYRLRVTQNGRLILTA